MLLTWPNETAYIKRNKKNCTSTGKYYNCGVYVFLVEASQGNDYSFRATWFILKELSSLIHPRVVLNLYDFLLLNIWDILNNVVNQTAADTIDFHSMRKNIIATLNQHSSKYVLRSTKETHTGLE